MLTGKNEGQLMNSCYKVKFSHKYNYGTIKIKKKLQKFRQILPHKQS
jgi:hypothetical protein